MRYFAPRQATRDHWRLSSLYAREEWAKGMKSTFWSKRDCPSVIVNGETEPQAIIRYALRQKAWKPNDVGNAALFCLEWNDDDPDDPNFYSAQDIIEICKAMTE